MSSGLDDLRSREPEGMSDMAFGLLVGFCVGVVLAALAILIANTLR